MRLSATFAAALLTLLVPGLARAYDGATGAGMERVPVFTRTLTAGETVTANDVTMGTVPAKDVFASTARTLDEVEGKSVSRAQAAGKPVSRLHLKDIPAVARDSMVTLVYRRPGLNLSGQGRALADGNLGESIRVLNPESRSTLVATVVASGMVEIR